MLIDLHVFSISRRYFYGWHLHVYNTLFFFFYIDHSKAILIKKVKISIFVKILWKWHVQLTINAITPYWYIINSKNYLIVCIQNTNYTSIARYRLILKNYEKYWNENFILIYLWKKKWWLESNLNIYCVIQDCVIIKLL